MPEGNAPQELLAALDAIRATIKAKGKDKVCDKNISNLENCIDALWGDMRTIYFPHISRSDESKEVEKIAFEAMGWQAPPKAPDPDDIPTRYRDVIEVIFPKFAYKEFPLERALDSRKDAVMKLLPYLLSAYYLSIYRVSLSYSVGKCLFPDAENSTRDHNFGTDANRFVARFSLAERIPAFLRSKRTRDPDLSRLTSCDEMLKYLRTSPRAEVYYSQVMKAFIYSTCATACIRTLPDEDKRKIDFEQSYRLFDEHTLAFSTPYGVSELRKEDLEEFEYSRRMFDKLKSDKSEVSNGINLLKCLKRAKPAEWSRFYSDGLDAIKQCVHLTFLMEYEFADVAPTVNQLLEGTTFHKCSPDSQSFYMQYATMCFVLYNPLAWTQLGHYRQLIERVLRYDRQEQCYKAPYLSGPRLKT